MKIKHKVIKEFQYLSPDKKIFILNVGTILEEYNYRVKTEIIPIDRAIIDNNPSFFEVIDWQAELLIYIKANKLTQPAQLAKKIIPFIEEMILSSIGQNSGPSLDPSVLRDVEKRESDVISSKLELERKERDLNSRENRIKDKEDEIDIRLKRVEKRETEYKDDLKNLDKKEDDLRQKSKGLIERGLELDDKLQEMKEKERNLDLTMLKSSEEIDSKYTELQQKINKDLSLLSEREKDLEVQLRKLKSKESDIEQKESDINDAIRNLAIKIEEVNLEEQSLMNLNQEIKDWESTHWKMRRNSIPPSAIVETIAEELKAQLGL
jgi:myosin heavy subunit